MFSAKGDDIQKKINDALLKGNKEELQQAREEADSQLKQTNTEISEAASKHAQLLRDLALSRDLLEPLLNHSMSKLNELREQGKLSTATVPLLKEFLNATTCICGESLVQHHPQGQLRRENIERLIEHLTEQSRKPDEFRSRLTDLYDAAAQLQLDQATAADSWVNKYTEVAKRRDKLEHDRGEQARRLSEINAQIKRLPKTDIQGLHDTKEYYEDQRMRAHKDQVQKEDKLTTILKEKGSVQRKYDRLLNKKGNSDRVLSKLKIIRDTEKVLEKSRDRIKNDERVKVSDLMDKFFRDMIGSDPEQGAIIRRAEISPEFDILVYGPEDRTLNPDRDLNGASRRALTLAFILALTKVSGEEAPNVIDTPLGMMSGYVKRAVLQTAIGESSQLILFLTRSEITDCEEILDTAAGRVITLTNSAHYPKMLKNDPQVSVRKILRCQCNHHRECSICERHLDPVDGMEAAI